MHFKFSLHPWVRHTCSIQFGCIGRREQFIHWFSLWWPFWLLSRWAWNFVWFLSFKFRTFWFWACIILSRISSCFVSVFVASTSSICTFLFLFLQCFRLCCFLEGFTYSWLGLAREIFDFEKTICQMTFSRKKQHDIPHIRLHSAPSGCHHRSPSSPGTRPLRQCRPHPGASVQGNFPMAFGPGPWSGKRKPCLTAMVSIS